MKKQGIGHCRIKTSFGNTKLLRILLTCLALMLVAAPMDAQKRSKSTTRKTATRKTATTKKSTQSAVTTKPAAIDMGLSVKWCNMDLGASNSKSPGQLYDEDADPKEIMGQGWRKPTTSELKELFANSTCQLILNSAGAPSHIKCTSNKNGASINFYFPKTWVIRPDGTKAANPNKDLYILCFRAENGDDYMLMCTKMPQQLRSLTNRFFKEAGITSTNPADWPSEVRSQFYKQVGEEVYMDSSKTYMGGAQPVDNIDEKAKIQVRPVFEVDDED